MPQWIRIIKKNSSSLKSLYSNYEIFKEYYMLESFLVIQNDFEFLIRDERKVFIILEKIEYTHI